MDGSPPQDAPEADHGRDAPQQPLSRKVRFGIPSVLFGLIDAALVHQGGTGLGSSLIAGATLGAFIAAALLLIDRVRSARASGEPDRGTVTPRVGSWANPSRSQRFVTRIRHLRGPGANASGHPLDGGKRPRR